MADVNEWRGRLERKVYRHREETTQATHHMLMSSNTSLDHNESLISNRGQGNNAIEEEKRIEQMANYKVRLSIKQVLVCNSFLSFLRYLDYDWPYGKSAFLITLANSAQTQTQEKASKAVKFPIKANNCNKSIGESLFNDESNDQFFSF